MWNSAQPEVIGNISLIGSDDDVVPLAHADVEDGRLIRCDWYKVGSNDLHSVIVDHELEVGVDGCVHESNAVRGPGGE